MGKRKLHKAADDYPGNYWWAICGSFSMNVRHKDFRGVTCKRCLRLKKKGKRNG